MEKTMIYSGGVQMPAKLYVIRENNEIKEISVQRPLLVGRANTSIHVDLALEGKIISRRHGEFVVVNDHTYYRDLDSSNGTYINDQLYGVDSKDGAKQKLLQNGDVIRIGEYILLYTTEYSRNFTWKVLRLQESIAELNIGRRSQSDGGIGLNDKIVSRNHATFFRGRDGWAIMDHNSTNGVFLNNNRLGNPVYLNSLDVIRIGTSNFIFMGDQLLWQQDLREAQYDSPHHQSAGNQLVIHIEERSVWQRFKKLTLLQDINLTVNNGEMVLILGGSGAGKTTFMNAVIGYEKADGTIMHGNRNIYTDYEQMKYEIGFVPQQDLLRGSDSVYDTLHNAAKMKLPRKIGESERNQRIEEVLELLGLQRECNTLVVKLSGGQRKRLSIAVEFIADPSLFFLDEPDSGLDGIMARSLMENLRSIADRGKIVMVITHGPDRAADLFDKVLVLAKSTRDNCGHLAFYGGVKEAYQFFETDSLEGIVRRINRPDEGGDGLSDHYIDRFRGGR